MKHGSLFSGIGGFELAAQWMGWQNVFHCEKEPFGQRVLKHYWPESKCYEDVTTTDFGIWRGKLDLLTGGFPCQPYSAAGKRLGKEDDRHLWPYMLRAIREISPRWVVGENVRGLVSWNEGLVFDEVQADLETEGYEVQPFILPACAVNAPHRRDRVWFVACRNAADSVRQGLEGRQDANRWEEHDQERGRNRHDIGAISESISTECRRNFQDFPTQPPICGGDDGLPRELDGITFSKWRNESIKAYGNAIVPQVALQIFKAIEQYETR